MKIPKKIQNKMHKAAKKFAEAYVLMNDVDVWFDERGLIEKVRCGNGISLEEIESGNDITDEFVDAADRDFSDSGWFLL